MSALPEESRQQEEEDIFEEPEQKKQIQILRDLKTTPQTSASDRPGTKSNEERFFTPDQLGPVTKITTCKKRRRLSDLQTNTEVKNI